MRLLGIAILAAATACSTSASPSAGTFASVSAGAYHTCGVRTDGTIACWGDNDYGQAAPPGGIFTSVSAGGRTTLTKVERRRRLSADGAPSETQCVSKRDLRSPGSGKVSTAVSYHEFLSRVS